MADQLVDVKTLEGLTQLPRSWLYAKAAAGETTPKNSNVVPTRNQGGVKT